MSGLRVFCFCMFVLALGGCELFVPLYPQDHDVEPNPWVGEWRVESIDGEPLSGLYADGEENAHITVTNSWTFNVDGTWQAEFTIEVEYGNGYQFYGRYWVPLQGSYALNGPTYVLIVTGDEAGPFFDAPESIIGTWVIAGDTLTLTDELGSVIVFKKPPLEPVVSTEPVPSDQ